LDERREVRLVNGFITIPLIVATKHISRVKRVRQGPLLGFSSEEINFSWGHNQEERGFACGGAHVSLGVFDQALNAANVATALDFDNQKGHIELIVGDDIEAMSTALRL
jgi:hypothetical protein